MIRNFLLVLFLFFICYSKAICKAIPEINTTTISPRKWAVFLSTTQQETFGYRVSTSYEVFQPLQVVIGLGERIFPDSISDSHKTKSAVELVYGVKFRTRLNEALYLLTYAQNVSTSTKNAKNNYDSIESGIAYGLGTTEGTFFELGLGIRYLWNEKIATGLAAIQERWKMFPSLSVGRQF